MPPAECNVLIVEDDEGLRHLLTTFLRRCCSSVTTAVDGEEAIDLLQRNTYDIVVLDIMLPKINGFQVAKMIQSLKPSPRMVVVSAVARHFEDRFPEDAIILQKPFDLHELSNAVLGVH